ncbi:hypothetical protein LZ31DRAFT_592474 [Colletotrichum somersetense]|nr:hypothetical protein LZ31DRAFT_592474 [Colletotrichum somersetense]
MGSSFRPRAATPPASTNDEDDVRAVDFRPTSPLRSRRRACAEVDVEAYAAVEMSAALRDNGCVIAEAGGGREPGDVCARRVYMDWRTAMKVGFHAPEGPTRPHNWAGFMVKDILSSILTFGQAEWVKRIHAPEGKGPGVSARGGAGLGLDGGLDVPVLALGRSSVLLAALGLAEV